MQFGLRTLLLAMAVCGAFCALFFAVPLVVEIPVLALITLLSPSVWIVGAFFARPQWRAFFLGGICAGWLPQLLIMYYAAMVVVMMPAFFKGTGEVLGMSQENALAWRCYLAGGFLAPFILAMLGGSCGVLVYRWFGPLVPQPLPVPESSRLHEPYVLLESRLTALAKPAEVTG